MDPLTIIAILSGILKLMPEASDAVRGIAEIIRKTAKNEPYTEAEKAEVERLFSEGHHRVQNM